MGGFRHYELYFPDGSCPTEAIVDRFLLIAENEGASSASRILQPVKPPMFVIDWHYINAHISGVELFCCTTSLGMLLSHNGA